MQRVSERRPEILTAPANAMTAALKLLESSGGAANWLVTHGLTDAELAQLRGRLVQ